MAHKRTLQQFITQSNTIHNHSFTYEDVVYVNDNTKVIVNCLTHGGFEVTPTNHIHRKSCCPECWKEKKKIIHNKPVKMFIKQANRIHNNFYDYSKVVYVNNHTKIEIICPLHGSFMQQPNVHTDQKCGCPLCSKSKGEKIINDWLTANQIEFETQKKFDDCKHKRKLSFDFFLPKNNILIEYNGIQHYRNVPLLRYSNDEFEDIKIRDRIKKKYTKDKGLSLLIIPYTCKDIELKLRQAILK